MIYNVCIFVIVVIIDLMSLTKLRKTKKKFLGQRGNGLAAARESKREKRREMLLFLQVCVLSRFWRSAKKNPKFTEG
ncbi:hypothetical protein ANCCEY_12793 [Ancylostoma ceylanicum]|uniref:Uncharacterized protein n=1 Tax=Ancylostoma ceylanicum TaxID=53326 RepID=A0A0D6LDW2_9BILA|nr:hypothetical protein ANCCEY_12793 [Ancylostoma ceylanicum]